MRVGLDDAEVEATFDLHLALQLLREHKRRLPGSADGRKNQRTTARSATNKEIAEALAKRLRTFAIRHGFGGAPSGPSTIPSSGNGPPPHPAEPGRED